MQDSKAFSGFSVDDIPRAKQFYGETLGLKVSEAEEEGLLVLHLAGDRQTLIYHPLHPGIALPPLTVPLDADAGIGATVRVLQVEPLDDPVPAPERKRRPVTAPEVEPSPKSEPDRNRRRVQR